jgi:hypothetical protein
MNGAYKVTLHTRPGLILIEKQKMAMGMNVLLRSLYCAALNAQSSKDLVSTFRGKPRKFHSQNFPKGAGTQSITTFILE